MYEVSKVVPGLKVTAVLFFSFTSAPLKLRSGNEQDRQGTCFLQLTGPAL